ncbi:hypothetical protein ACWD4L_34135 [Streptomyces sp. NPDC002596]
MDQWTTTSPSFWPAPTLPLTTDLRRSDRMNPSVTRANNDSNSAAQ